MIFLAIARREAIPSLHQSNLNPTRYGRLQIPLPPKREQKAIVKYIFEQTSDLDIAVNRAKREIDLLYEYRTRLIADVVTGKLNVREAATRLPDEPEDVEPVDEIDETDELAEDTELEESDD